MDISVSGTKVSWKNACIEEKNKLSKNILELQPESISKQSKEKSSVIAIVPAPSRVEM